MNFPTRHRISRLGSVKGTLRWNIGSGAWIALCVPRPRLSVGGRDPGCRPAAEPRTPGWQEKGRVMRAGLSTILGSQNQRDPGAPRVPRARPAGALAGGPQLRGRPNSEGAPAPRAPSGREPQLGGSSEGAPSPPHVPGCPQAAHASAVLGNEACLGTRLEERRSKGPGTPVLIRLEPGRLFPRSPLRGLEHLVLSTLVRPRRLAGAQSLTLDGCVGSVRGSRAVRGRAPGSVSEGEGEGHGGDAESPGDRGRRRANPALLLPPGGAPAEVRSGEDARGVASHGGVAAPRSVLSRSFILQVHLSCVVHLCGSLRYSLVQGEYSLVLLRLLHNALLTEEFISS